MNFQSIIGFIFFIIITSLFNKGKQQQGQNRRRTQPMHRDPSTSTATPRYQQNSKPSGGNRLEDMLREMKSDVRGVFGELQGHNTPKAPLKEAVIEEPVEDHRETWDGEYYYHEETEEVEESKALTNKSDMTTYDEDEGSFEEEGPPKKRNSLKLTQNSLVQGIIMSEILDKPKSLRSRRR